MLIAAATARRASLCTTCRIRTVCVDAQREPLTAATSPFRAIQPTSRSTCMRCMMSPPLFFQRAMQYRCRVTDAQLADIFYVPAWNTDMVSHPSSACAERPRGADVPLGALPQNEFAGSRALRRMGQTTSCSHRGPALGTTSRSPCASLTFSILGLVGRAAIDRAATTTQRIDARGPFGYYADLAFLSVPYPSWVRLHLDSVRRGSTQQTARDTVEEAVPWRHRHARHVRVAAAFGTGHGSPLIVALRQRLKDLCTGARDTEGTTACVYTSPPSKSHKHAASPASQPPFHVTAAQLYWNATFCLMPGGDSATRRQPSTPCCSGAFLSSSTRAR